MTNPTLPTAGVVELLARVESAMEMDAQLLIRVAANIFPDAYPSGWVLDKNIADWRFLRFERFIGAGAWTDAVLALCERVLGEGWVWSVSIDYELPGRAHLFNAMAPHRPLNITADGNTPTLALLAALLKAKANLTGAA